MKAKLGTLQQVGNSQYAGFRGLLKKSVQAILQDKTNGHMVSYVLIKGDQLNWKCGGKDPEKPLLFLDQNYNSLVKDIKASKDIDLKGYSYGQCKVTQVGTDVTVYLCPEKGKLTQPTEFKPLEKLFKKFKPKLFFEIVADLATVVEDVVAEGGNTLDENDISARAKAIGLNLMQYHKNFQVLDKNVKAMDKTDPKIQPLRVKRHTVLKHLRHLTTAWKEDILPHETKVTLDANWTKLYNYWAAFFAKQEAAKTGDTTDTDAQKTAEEHLYVKALEDLDRFFDDLEKLEKGKRVDPDIIDNDVQTLEDHLAEWQKFAKGKSAFPEQLKELETLVKETKNDWVKFKPLTKEYNQKAKELEVAMDLVDYELVDTLFKRLEEIEKEMNAIS
ncbi:MAG: hypothetical protein AB8E82_15985 [Aureispira sp.]